MSVEPALPLRSSCHGPAIRRSVPLLLRAMPSPPRTAEVLAAARHRPHTLATREIHGLLLSMAPEILAKGDAA